MHTAYAYCTWDACNRTEALWVHRLMFVLLGLSDCRMQLLTYLRYIPALPVHKCEKDALVRRQRGLEDSYPSLAGRWGDQVDSTQRESALTTTLQLLPRWTLPSGLMNRTCGWIGPALFLNEHVYQAARPTRCWWMEAKRRRDTQQLMRLSCKTTHTYIQPTQTAWPHANSSLRTAKKSDRSKSGSKTLSLIVLE